MWFCIVLDRFRFLAKSYYCIVLVGISYAVAVVDSISSYKSTGSDHKEYIEPVEASKGWQPAHAVGQQTIAIGALKSIRMFGRNAPECG